MIPRTFVFEPKERSDKPEMKKKKKNGAEIQNFSLQRNQININELREHLQRLTSAPLQALSMILLSSVAMESSSNKPARAELACKTEIF